MRPISALLLAAVLACVRPAAAAQPELPESPETIKISPKADVADSREAGRPAGELRLLAPDTDVIDTPTTAVLDYGGYSARTRFFAKGGVLQYINFGVFQSLNLGASLTMDGLVGHDRTVRVRAPSAQVKYRFFGGDRMIPSFAVGYDGQGYNYNSVAKRYNHRQRGFFVAASQELGLPGLLVHPSVNISDFDTNSFFGAIPVTLNIQDRVSLLWEWDNINNFSDSRVNSGLRVYVTPGFHLDFAVRSIGQGGTYSNGDSRGPERIVQIRYSGNF